VANSRSAVPDLSCEGMMKQGVSSVTVAGSGGLVQTRQNRRLRSLCFFVPEHFLDLVEEAFDERHCIITAQLIKLLEQLFLS